MITSFALRRHSAPQIGTGQNRAASTERDEPPLDADPLGAQAEGIDTRVHNRLRRQPALRQKRIPVAGFLDIPLKLPVEGRLVRG